MEKRIIRVFPRKTSYTPNDEYAFVGMPPIFLPEHDEIHVSCTFTWDKAYAEELAFQWEGRTNKPVRLGGPAYNSLAEDFVPGMYIKRNIIFTTRGCNNNCTWCCVPKLEGKLKELPVVPGNWIQDNNFVQSSKRHKERVFEREKIKCYVLSYGKDMEADEQRARTVYEAGAMPFMQLYRDFSGTKTEYSTEWNAFARMWQRPAAIRAHMEKGTDFRDFNT